MSETWLELARDARKAASTLMKEERYRSVAARAYYAVYSKITYELTIARLPMPPGLEGPKHKRLRPLILSSMPNMNQEKREALSRVVGRLYTLRIDSDYKPSVTVNNREAREALSLMNKIFEAF